MSYQKPYKGLKVIDFSQGVAGPYCGMLLAQHGAEVIKIEPKDGDWARNLGQEYGEHSAFSVAANNACVQRQLGCCQQEGFSCQIPRHTINFEHDATWLYPGYPIFGRALTFTHPHLSRL